MPVDFIGGELTVGSKLYVSNLNYSVASSQMQELFSGNGEVRKVDIVKMAARISFITCCKEMK